VPTLGQLSAEQQVVLGAVRRAFGLPSMVPSPKTCAVDWDLVVGLTIQQGLLPLVCAGLDPTHAPPPAVRTALRAKSLAASVRHEQQVEPLLRSVLGALTAAGLEPIVLKGGALAFLAYPQAVYRTLRDIDLLLPGDQLERTDQVLRGLGFWTDPSIPEPTHHLRPYQLDGVPLTVEVHHKLIQDPHPFSIDLPALRARAQIRTLAGVEGLVLAPPDALLHACLHLASSGRYRYFQLRALVDALAISARSDDPLDWRLFLEIVRRAGAAGAVYWPLCLSRLWLGAPVPEEVLAELAPPKPIRKLVAAITQPDRLMGQQVAGGGMGVLLSALTSFSLHTGLPLHTQVRALWWAFFPKPEAIGHLPPSVTHSRVRYAAYLLRPKRLLRGVLAVKGLSRRLFG
jgi:hypothetical protein